MNDKELIEANRLIKKFMQDNAAAGQVYGTIGMQRAAYIDDWNLLMEVFYKFRDLHFTQSNHLVAALQHKQIIAPVKYALTHYSIKEVFIELVTAINWYNTISFKQN